MSQPHKLGLKGEDLAVDHLKKAGYTIRHRNWKYGKKEIDIVAENNDFVIFVEVKTRTDGYQVPPLSAITSEKQRSIIFAADGYLRKYFIDKESRFDVIAIINKGGSQVIDHIEDAFYPTLR
jgi:putative endonuclease